MTHNAMGNFDEVDYFRVAESLDFLSWDSYPLGQIDKGLLPDIDIAWWARTGQPDLVSFNHDLMRGIKAGAGPGPIVMEQQAGQINWARPIRCPPTAPFNSGRCRHGPMAATASAISAGARRKRVRRRCIPDSSGTTARSIGEAPKLPISRSPLPR